MVQRTHETLRPKVEDRSTDILYAAFAEFTKCGYVATRMENIAKRAGITKGLIYFYFKNKEDLFIAAFQECIKKPVINTITGIRPAESMASHIARVINNLYNSFVDAPFFPSMIRLILLEGQNFPELREHYLKDIVHPIINALRSLLEEGARRCEWTTESIPEFMHIIMSPAILFVLWKNTFQEFQPLDVNRYLYDHQKMLLRSLGLDDARIAAALAVAQTPETPAEVDLPPLSFLETSAPVNTTVALPRKPLIRRMRKK